MDPPESHAEDPSALMFDESNVGLSPAYWSHVPLTIRQVHELSLLNGIHCHIRTPTATTCNASSSSASVSVLPLSKCELVGIIVAVEQRGLDAGVVYVIDDGTGVIDCLHWQDDGDAMGLPPLLLTTPLASNNNITGSLGGLLSVGTLVRVLGRIECAAVSTAPIRDGGRHATGPSGHTLTTRSCLREIHASLVVDANDADGRPTLGGEDLESQHWKRCAQALDPAKLHSPDEVIHLLGPDIAQQISERASLPAVDDSDGAWRVFGSRCTCNLVYKDFLLYCHCQATVEPLDPDFVYRDALLKALLDAEHALVQQGQSQTTHPAPLRFQFRAVMEDANLISVAQTVFPSSSSSRQALILATFRALRKDGILYLLDQASDTYLLVSKDRVLKPYIETITSNDIERGAERVRMRREPPAFLDRVPKQRLQYIRRNLKA